MSKRSFLARYSLIFRKLQQKPYSTYEELKSYITYQLQFMDEDMSVGYSKRTLQRDFKDINQISGLNIEYSRRERGYYISEGANSSASFEKMMESFDVFNALGIHLNVTPFVYPQWQRTQGTENLYGLLHAIRNKRIIQFTYEKFEEREITRRITEPYFLKEFRNRWYLIAKDEKDGVVKSFGLDRLSELKIIERKYAARDIPALQERYRYCFGIVAPNPNSEVPSEVVLSFDALQGKYIKSLPLHETQEILSDTENELRIRLKVFLTYDLTMELLSFGDRMRVLQPQALVKTIREYHKDAYEQY